MWCGVDSRRTSGHSATGSPSDWLVVGALERQTADLEQVLGRPATTVDEAVGAVLTADGRQRDGPSAGEGETGPGRPGRRQLAGVQCGSRPR